MVRGPDDAERLAAALHELAHTPVGHPSGPAVQALVQGLSPVIRHRVARHLLAHPGCRPDQLRPVLDEFEQMVFAKLFEGHARVLRMWRPDGGLSLKNWVGRFASLRTRDVLRSGCHHPWPDPERLAEGAPLPNPSTPQELLATRELWEEACARLLAVLSPKGRRVFDLMFVHRHDDALVAEVEGLTDAALWRWRYRLRLQLRDALEAAAAVP